MQKCSAFASCISWTTHSARILRRSPLSQTSSYPSATLSPPRKVVTSTGKTDHKAVIAYTGSPLKTANKSRTQLTFRRRSPNQHALFLSHLSSLDITFDTSNPVQTNFDQFYMMLLSLLDRFYPQRKITITSTDPYFITPTVKSQLRRKNKLLRAGRVEEA